MRCLLHILWMGYGTYYIFNVIFNCKYFEFEERQLLWRQWHLEFLNLVNSQLDLLALVTIHCIVEMCNGVSMISCFSEEYVAVLVSLFVYLKKSKFNFKKKRKPLTPPLFHCAMKKVSPATLL